MAKSKTKKVSKPNPKFKKALLFIYPIVLILIFAKVYPYIFDEKIDMNGDNAKYYQVAKSLADGNGFSWAMYKGNPPANYPPGYVFFLSFFMLFTKSITTLKVINGFLLLSSSLLLFFVIKALSSNMHFALIVSVFLLLHANVLRFSSMMMSEMLYMFISILTLYFLMKMDYSSPPWKNKKFYFVVLLSAYAYYIRPQGISLIGGILFLYFFTWNWKYLFSGAIGFVLLIIPWRIRNHMAGFSGSYHAGGIMLKNSFRPEEGQATLSDFIERIGNNLESYITNQVPGSLFYYLKLENVNVEPQTYHWVIGLAIIGLIVFGIIKFPRLKLFFTGYLLANMAALLIIPYGVAADGRYFITFIPFLLMAFFWGLYSIIAVLLKLKSNNAVQLIPYLFLLFLIPVSQGIKRNHNVAKAKLNPNYQAYYDIAKVVNEKTEKNTVICCRKPGLFYIYAERPVTNYLKTSDNKELIQGLINNEVDYVVLDQLGYSSTGLYLYPAIKNNPTLFPVVLKMGDPETYLLQFKRNEAEQMLNAEE